MRLRGGPTVLFLGIPALVTTVLWVHAKLDAAQPLDAPGAPVFVVSSPEDDGPGSLRDAVFSANASETRPRIRIDVSSVRLQSPLPPLVGARGMTVVSDSTTIEGDGFAGVFFEVHSPGTVLRGLRLTGDGQTCVRVAATDVDVVGLAVEGCGVALDVLETAHRFELVGSEMARNEIGVRVAPEAASARIVENQFAGHASAAIWSIGPSSRRSAPALEIDQNLFNGDRIGMIVGNRATRVTGNEVVDPSETGVYAIGDGITILRNRITGSGASGIVANATRSGLIAGNEVDHNLAMGILLTSAEDTRVTENRAHENGYGIAVVFGDDGTPNRLVGNTALGNEFDGISVWGASPVLRSNASTQNGSAGLRILDVVDAQVNRRTARPFMDGNTLQGNRIDGPVRGSYRSP